MIEVAYLEPDETTVEQLAVGLKQLFPLVA
jgi:hypothetical protein